MTLLTPTDLAALPEQIVPRVRRTTSCRDADVLPRVAGAGEVVDLDVGRVQVMHSGVLVEAGGYFGDWMQAIIRGLDGVHEPQEEVVFAAVLDRLAATGPDAPTMVEPGCFWAYYSLWFLQRFPQGRALAMEPDPAHLDVGRRNAVLNGVTDRLELREGVVGPEPGRPLAFTSETTGAALAPVQHDLAALLAAAPGGRVDLLACDIQGAETALLRGGLDLLRGGVVRFLVVSTHHHSISGDPLTHRTVLDLLVGAGAHVIAEHSVAESASGDGLVAVSFDPADRDLTVDVSHLRADDAIFPTLEHDLAAATAATDAAREQVVALGQERDALAAELARTRGTLGWRLTRGPAGLAHRVRRSR